MRGWLMAAVQLLADLPGLLGPLAGVSVGGHTLVEWAGLVADNVTDSLDMMTTQCAEGDQYLQFCDDIFTTGTPNDLVFEGTFTVHKVLIIMPLVSCVLQEPSLGSSWHCMNTSPPRTTACSPTI